jgi:DNA-binding IclR family transcriptional regulator
MEKKAAGGKPPKESTDAPVVGADRVLAVLRELARHPDGIGLDEMATAIGSAKPTVHRALASLRRAGFAAQDGRGRYALGDDFLRLAFAYHEARPEHLRVLPALQELATYFGETAHYAVLDGRDVVYRAKVDPPLGAARLSSVIGGRNPAHCTGVGKLLLATALPDDDAVRDWVRAGPLERRTDRTKVTAAALCTELRRIRDNGYSVDDGENEAGVVCVAVPAFLTSPSSPSGAVSVSALEYRTSLSTLIDSAAKIRSVVDAVGVQPR